MDYQALVGEAANRPLDPNHSKALRQLLSSDGPLLASLGQIQRLAHEIAWSLQAVDLGSDEGRMEAVRLQGRIQGLSMAIETILEPAKELE